MRIIIFCYFFVLQASSQVQVITLESEALGTRTVRVYLPKSYEHSKKKYPVIYMHDGQNLFDAKTSFAGEWRIDETLDSLRAEVIVVAIDHGNDRRIDELTLFAHPKHGGGKGKDYIDFLINTVRPAINRDFRVKKGKYHTAIGGSSLGGLISWFTVLDHPKVFGKAILFSPSLWFTDDIYRKTEEKKNITTRTYLLAGDSESDSMVPDANRFADILRTRIRPGDLKFEIVKDGKHNEKLWSDSFAKAYLWVFGGDER